MALGNPKSNRAAVASPPCVTSVDEYHRIMQAYARGQMAAFGIPDKASRDSVMNCSVAMKPLARGRLSSTIDYATTTAAAGQTDSLPGNT